ncbi:MAG: patatin-like phospholipase family protein, partial [Ferruginibacter sp.]
AWLNQHVKDSAYDMYFVMANGGASRSGYWTASVLGKLQDASAKKDSNNLFSDHVFCLSGTSGGGVGVAAFFSLLQGRNRSDAQFETSAKDYLKRDYFTYTFARLLGPDYFSDVLNIFKFIPVHAADRAAALEESFEKSVPDYKTDAFRVPFDKNFSTFAAMNNAQTVPLLPILCINSTRMQDGNPGIVSNLRIDSATFNNRIDILTLLDSTSDISMASGSILGARFPYLSPAGKIGDSYFVDGGYFDNSGAGVVQEMIRGIIKIANDSPALREKINLLRFKVLHIVNSPVINSRNKFEPVASVKNDLLAPVLTIMGAYDMQTTVNDQRLINYIHDVADSNHRASYTRISLYEDELEWKNDMELNTRFDIEPSYAMNWFISDTTLNRINKRLSNGRNRILDSLVKTFQWGNGAH